MSTGILKKICKCPHCSETVYIIQQGNDNYILIKPIETEPKEIKPSHRQSTLLL